MRIISMEKGGDVKRVFERLSRGVKAIEDGLKKILKEKDVFMSDPILGMSRLYFRICLFKTPLCHRPGGGQIGQKSSPFEFHPYWEISL